MTHMSLRDGTFCYVLKKKKKGGGGSAFFFFGGGGVRGEEGEGKKWAGTNVS